MHRRKLIERNFPIDRVRGLWQPKRLAYAVSARWSVQLVIESGEFSPNTTRLTACRAVDTVADGKKVVSNSYPRRARHRNIST